MKISCDIIKDLLPLYVDGACSDESVNLVEEHLKECSDCTNELSRLKENTPVFMLKSEENIIGTFRKSTLKKVLFAAVCLLLFPLLNMGIIAMYGLFSPKVFIISALVMLNTVVLPTIIKRNRKAVITVSSLIVPVIIFLIFGFRELLSYDYKNYSEYAVLNIILYAVPSLVYFGLSGAFIPVKIRADHESPMRYKKTVLKVAAMETCVLTVGIVMANFMYMGEINALQFARVWYLAFQLIFLWAAALVFRFAKGSRFIKASIYTAIGGAYCVLYPVVEDFCYRREGHCFWQADFTALDSRHLIANVSMIILILTAVVSLGLFAIGKWGNKVIIPENNSEDTAETILDSTPENNSEDTAEITPDSSPENKE